MTYQNIKSTFVKKELQKTEWKNREYIDDLIDIEAFATSGYCSTGAGYIRDMLRDKYSKQWKTIWLELAPQKYTKILLREQKEKEQGKKENKMLKKEKVLQAKREKEEWKKRGGKI